MWHHQKETFHPYFIMMVAAKFRSVGCRRKNQLTQIISKWKFIIMWSIHRGRIIHLPRKCKNFLMGGFQCSGIMQLSKKCVTIFKRQLKFLFHHNTWLSLIKIIFKLIKNLQFLMFLMIHHVMRIPQWIYHMTTSKIGRRTTILKPLKKLFILNFELMNIFSILQVFLM